MLKVVTLSLVLAGLCFSSVSFAQSTDVEATISRVDSEKLTIVLDDGKTYQVPEEFNFEGLKAGVKVVVFYTVADGRRVIEDLQVMAE